MNVGCNWSSICCAHISVCMKVITMVLRVKKKHRVYGPRKCETSSAAIVFFEQEPCQDDAIAPGASVLWRWLERCLESSSAPDIALLRDAVPEQKDRTRTLAVLGDKTMGQVEGLHLTLASLDARVVDATLPLLATFDEVQQLLPSKAVMDSVDLLDLPGYFASIGVEHLLRHQVVALLSCVLLSVSEERRLGWCRLLGFTIDSDMLEVAGRLWDVHTLKAPCGWDSSGGYEDCENVVEVGGCQNYCMVGWCLFFFMSCRFPMVLLAGGPWHPVGHEGVCGG